MRRRRNPEIIAGTVASTGAVLSSSGEFSVLRNSAGNYTVFLPPTFRIISAVASSASNGFPAGTAGGSQNSFTVIAYNSNSQIATDIQFSFVAVGVLV